jgi:ribosomal-protein-alanine N-acetyltransferase
MAPTEIGTERLLLRRWQESDREPFAALNADPVVMELFPAVLTRERSDALVDAIARMFAELDHGLWAVEERSSGRFAGFVGLAPADHPRCLDHERLRRHVLYRLPNPR